MKKFVCLIGLVVGCSGGSFDIANVQMNSDSDTESETSTNQDSITVVDDSSSVDDSSDVAVDTSSDSIVSSDSSSDSHSEDTNDAGPGYAIECGPITCTEGYVCCSNESTAIVNCKKSCEPTEAEFTCDGTEDCPFVGQYCCAKYSDVERKVLSKTECVAHKNCSSIPETDERLCNSTADCGGLGSFCCSNVSVNPLIWVCSSVDRRNELISRGGKCK